MRWLVPLLFACNGASDDDSSTTETGSTPTEDVLGFVETFADHDGNYETGEVFGDWRVVQAVDGATVQPASALSLTDATDATVFVFNELTDSFGENRLDRCLAIDRTQAIQFAVRVQVIGAEATTDQRIRINPNFYRDAGTCNADLTSNSTANRLSGVWTNDDWDIRLGALNLPQGGWADINRSTHGDRVGVMEIPAQALPGNATFMRYSVRLRDDDGDEAGRMIVLDQLRATQGS